MKRLLLLSAILFQFLLVKAQDSLSKTPVIHVATVTNTSSNNYGNSTNLQCSYFSISTDLLQYAVVQPNIGIEYKRNRFAFGVNAALVYPDPLFKSDLFVEYQYYLPGMIYNGEALKVFCKFYYNKNRPSNYLCVQVEAKYLWYNNVNFSDSPPEFDPSITDNYVMSEKTTAFGVDILLGRELFKSAVIHVDIFYGLGIRIMNRDFTVLSSTTLSHYGTPFPGPSGPVYVGNYKTTLTYPVPILGFKLGVNLFHKKDIADSHTATR